MTEYCPVYAPFFGALVSVLLLLDVEDAARHDAYCVLHPREEWNG